MEELVINSEKLVIKRILEKQNYSLSNECVLKPLYLNDKEDESPCFY